MATMGLLRRATPSSTRGRLLMIGGGLLLVVVALGLLALPFRHAPAAAEAARADLETAKSALEAGDVEGAGRAVESARAHADQVQGAVQGVGGHVWSWVPVAGGPVRDVRRLGNALDDLTSVAEVGVGLVSRVNSDRSTLVDDGNVDLEVLATVIDDVDEVDSLVDQAGAELDDVADDRLVAGDRLGEARNEVVEQMQPLVDGLATAQPLLAELPLMLGSQADRQYLVALLNPSELRYSGGTPLTFTTMDLSQGTLSMGDVVDTSTAPGTAQSIYWKKVKGNPFHRGRLKVVTSTMAPDWRVSGNELANAWRSLRGRRLAGVVVIDVPALADLVALTGPINVPTLGTITPDTLVETLVGSYDEYSDPAQRKEINRALAPLFSERLLSGDPLDTAKALARAADERRFAVYLRDPEEQAVFSDLGLTGELGDAKRDYIGVFTQNRVPSKSDYWQRRAVRSEVDVRKDGSARVRLAVQIHNDSPPYAQEGVDPQLGYFTRWNFSSVLTVLPEGAEFTGGAIDGEPVRVRRGNFYDQTFQRQTIELAPQARRELVVEYDVPAAATVEGDGSLAYGLTIDPQAIVNPQSVEVRVRFPKGYEPGALPAGWTPSGPRTVTYRTDALETTEVFDIVARP